jgi:excinuclease ABC subunit C
VLKELGIDNKVPIVGLAKRLEEVFYPGDPVPYYLSRTGEPLKVVCHIRDEAHRFGITFHRQKRNNALITSELDSIAGIGEKSRNALLKHFKSVRKIKEATLGELTSVVGNARATAIQKHFSKE